MESHRADTVHRSQLYKHVYQYYKYIYVSINEMLSPDSSAINPMVLTCWTNGHQYQSEVNVD